MNIGIIGYGSMGRMLVEKLSKNKDNRLYVYNRTIEKLKSLPPEIYICSSNSELASKVDIVIMCVRPLDIKLVLSEIAESVRADTLIVSLNGSVSFASMEKIINHKMAKVIPSLTAEIGKSQTLVCFNKKTGEDDKANLKSLFKYMGDVILLPENEMGMGSELVSCMPGFIASIFDVLCSAAGEHTSISEEQIVSMVLDTLCSTGELMLSKRMSFNDVVTRVATKGGITEEGTKVVYEKFPEIAKELFKKTLEKRRQTALKAEEIFE